MIQLLPWQEGRLRLQGPEGGSRIQAPRHLGQGHPPPRYIQPQDLEFFAAPDAQADFANQETPVSFAPSSPTLCPPDLSVLRFASCSTLLRYKGRFNGRSLSGNGFDWLHHGLAGLIYTLLSSIQESIDGLPTTHKWMKIRGVSSAWSDTRKASVRTIKMA